MQNLWPGRPPITRMSQVQGALVAGLAWASWRLWQSETQQLRPRPWLDLPLPPQAPELIHNYLQAWQNYPISSLRTQPPPHLPENPAQIQCLDIAALVAWGLGESEKRCLIHDSELPVPELKPNFWVSEYLDQLHQALSLQTPQGLERYGVSLSYWSYLEEKTTHPLNPAGADLAPELRGFLWGSLFGARWGLGRLPPLWLEAMPVELAQFAVGLVGAWAGAMNPFSPNGAITKAGAMNPR